MRPTQAGITALVTAYARAYHATHDSPKIFDDSMADQLYSPEEHRSFDKSLASALSRYAAIDPDFVASKPDDAAALAWIMQHMHGPVTLSRSRYAEECLIEAVRGGVRQYVILGAGFDTFAFRRPDLLKELQVFEVDHPVTQRMKRDRLALAGWNNPTQLHFVPIDFRAQSLTDILHQTDYDPKHLTFFSWLGVTFYLTREAVHAALRALTMIAPRDSTLVFDYMDADSFVPEKAALRTRLMHDIARQVGEPMQTGFEPQLLMDELTNCGLTLQENLDSVAIEARYFQGRNDGYHAFEHVHFARAILA